jgi:hypothetical protein
MEAVRIQQMLAKDGEMVVTGLPYQKGQILEIIVLPLQFPTVSRPPLTVRQFRQTGLIGMWQDRMDIQDSSVYARSLREKTQQRRHFDDDFTG